MANKAWEVFDLFADVMRESDAAWRERAECRGRSDLVFGRAEDTKLAKELCVECPVTAECLQAWLSAPLAQRVYGVWFGTTEDDRRRMPLRRELEAMERKGR